MSCLCLAHSLAYLVGVDDGILHFRSRSGGLEPAELKDVDVRRGELVEFDASIPIEDGEAR